jgi:hypothetical protein
MALKATMSLSGPTPSGSGFPDLISKQGDALSG